MKKKPLPKKIAKYAVDSVLGSGAMGVVYKAFDPQIERPVAIKVLHEHLRTSSNGDELAARFLQEARAAARCAHPNIVTVFDFGSEGVPYIVMEYVEGVELRARLKNSSAISLESALDITIQILDALAHAHSKGVVHRDIKPDNIILLGNGTVKVSDFGVARLDTSDLTGTGFMIGTPNYMSPEGLRGRLVDARSDLFSVGVLLYELVGRLRFNRDTPLAQNLEKIQGNDHLSSQNFNLLQRILTRALQAAPGDRYQNAEEFIQALEEIDSLDPLATVAFAPSQDEVPTLTDNKADSADQWSGELLLSLEQSLAPYVGPMAKLLVKKGSRSAFTLDDLIAQLVQHIPNQAERSQFKLRLERSGITGPVPVTAGGAVKTPPEKTRVLSQGISEAKQAALTALLTFYTGPIANRLIRKYLPESLDFAQLAAACARHIPDTAERLQFIEKANRL